MRRLPLSGRTDRTVAERVFIGLGGNLGDPRKAMTASLRSLAASPTIEVTGVSSLYRTPPWGKTDQPDFLNAVAELACEVSPRELLDLCLDIELDLKRERTEKWGPRLIDIDILAFGEETIDEAGLVVPHQRLHERAFVLAPFAEIAPNFMIGGIRVRDLLATVEQDSVEVEVQGGGWAGFELSRSN